MPSASIRTTTPICNSLCHRSRLVVRVRTTAPRHRATRSRSTRSRSGLRMAMAATAGASCRPLNISRTMPAATVACDTGSIRMKLPVQPVGVIGIEKQRARGLHVDHADAVELEGGSRLGIERLHVHAMPDGGDPGLDRLRSVLEQIASWPGSSGWAFIQTSAAAEVRRQPPAAGGRQRASLRG